MSKQSCSNCLENCKVCDDKMLVGQENRCLYFIDKNRIGIEAGSILKRLKKKYGCSITPC